jgi:hypothetical protein
MADEKPDDLVIALRGLSGSSHVGRTAGRAAEEIEWLRHSVIAFCAVWAAAYARDYGLPDGHLHPTHYDILARCGARMDAFTRAECADAE